MRTHKEKAQARQRLGLNDLAFVLSHTKRADSTSPKAGRKAVKPYRCPVCNKASPSKSVALADSGETMHAKLCESCGGAVAMSTAFGRAAFHRLAQHQHHREVSHAA